MIQLKASLRLSTQPTDSIWRALYRLESPSSLGDKPTKVKGETFPSVLNKFHVSTTSFIHTMLILLPNWAL